MTAVGNETARLAALLKVAELEPGDGCTFNLQLAGAQYDLLNDPERKKVIDDAASRLFGADAQVTMAQRSLEAPSETPRYSIVNAEAEARSQERQRLREVIADDKASGIIRDIFEPTAAEYIPRDLVETGRQEAES